MATVIAGRYLPWALVMSFALACGGEPAAPLRIGTSLPLTGDFDEQGKAAEKGYKAWAAIVNGSGGVLGRKVELVFRDNASDVAMAEAQYEELITKEKVELVLGTFSSKLNIPSSAVVAKHGYAFVMPAAGAPGVFNRGLTNIFFAQPAPADESADAFVAYIKSMPTGARPTTFVLATLDDPFAQGIRERVRPALMGAGLNLLLDVEYKEDLKDFSAIAAQVKALDPDLIFGCTQNEDAIGQLLAYKAAGYQPRGAFLTNGPTVPTSFRAALMGNTEGIFSTISWFPEAQGFQNAEFISRHIQLYQGNAQDVAEDAANAFTAGQVLEQALENVGRVDNAALIAEMHKGLFQTVVGPLSFDAQGRPKGSHMILQWQGESFVIVAPENRQQRKPVWPKPPWRP